MRKKLKATPLDAEQDEEAPVAKKQRQLKCELDGSRLHGVKMRFGKEKIQRKRILRIHSRRSYIEKISCRHFACPNLLDVVAECTSERSALGVR